MRKVAVKFIAVFTVLMLALAFGECICACDDDGGADDVSCCLASCACCGVGFTIENPSPVVPRVDRAEYRSGDVQVSLPVVVADIFNPPKV